MAVNYKINPKLICFAIITYYPKWYRGKLRSIKHTDKVRGNLALEFFRKAIKFGYRIVVADGKSSKTFRKELSRMNGLLVIKRKSLKRSVARRQTLKKASRLESVKAIIMTEPEKISLLDSIEKIASPILEGRTDIVVPKRNPDLFQKTYPNYMYESEIEGNKLYNETLRTNGLLKINEDLDMFFGPRIFRNDKKITSLFTRNYYLKIGKGAYLNSYFDHETYSTTLYFPIVLALKKNLRVMSIDIPFKYPKIQKDSEEKGSRELFLEKRKNQRISILVELLHFTSYIKK